MSDEYPELPVSLHEAQKEILALRAERAQKGQSADSYWIVRRGAADCVDVGASPIPVRTFLGPYAELELAASALYHMVGHRDPDPDEWEIHAYLV